MRDKHARTAPQPKPHEDGFLNGCSSVFGVLSVGLFALTFLFQNFAIPSSSMASTLLVGDHVMVERESLAPRSRWAPFLPYREVHRRDVIVFYKPLEERDGEHIFLVKRVIGIPGDRLHLRNGVVFLNGVAQTEGYAAQPTEGESSDYVDEFPSVNPGTNPEVSSLWALTLDSFVHGGDLVVPPGQYFAMGDSRNNSIDSRFWGFVPRENIVGRPLFVYWSIVSPESGVEEAPISERAAATLREVLHFLDQTRWSRTFHRIT